MRGETPQCTAANHTKWMGGGEKVSWQQEPSLRPRWQVVLELEEYPPCQEASHSLCPSTHHREMLAPPPPRLTGIISKGALVLFGWVCRMTQFTLRTLTLEQLIALVKAAIMTYLLPNIGPNGVRLCCKSIQCNSCNLHRLL